jgi:serine/threonine protein kinase
MAKTDDQVGNWTLRKPIGSGGQGQVFAASKSEGEQLVALKLIRAVRPKKRSRFLQEIAIHVVLSSQGTENVMPVIDHNLEELKSGGVRGFIVMPLAETSLEKERSLLTNRISF